MQLSKRTQYGLRAMICFADAYNRGHLQSRELVKREKLPPKFLESILSALTRGKFLVSKIGSSGGYRLARSPKEIKVGDIIARLEGNRLMSTDEVEIEEGEAPGQVGVRIMQARLTDALQQVLNVTTLAQLTEQVGQLSGRGQMYYI